MRHFAALLLAAGFGLAEAPVAHPGRGERPRVDRKPTQPMVTPGFINAHMHLPAFSAPGPPPLLLRFVNGEAAAARRIAAYAAALPEGHRILGGRLDGRDVGRAGAFADLARRHRAASPRLSAPAATRRRWRT